MWLKPEVESAWFPAKPCRLVIQSVVFTVLLVGVGYQEEGQMNTTDEV